MKPINELRLRMVRQAHDLGYGHICSALSALPIIMDIYKTFDFNNDVFILSKGHACYALYAVLECFDLKPDWNRHEPLIDRENGVTCTTGSLGHGLPVATGIAYAKALKGEPGHVHVLMGDGECAEGTTWESLLFIEHFKLKDNITIHVDCNCYQAISKTIYSKVTNYMAAFRLNVIPHIRIKGYGIKYFEQHADWHVHQISDEELAETIKELT